MFIYAFRQYTAWRQGTAVKHVRCEKCGGDFSYEALRRGSGSGHSPYFLSNEDARHEAISQARSSLAKKLEAAIEALPCPKCGWVQEAMVRELRRRSKRWIVKAGWLLAILAWASAGIGVLTATEAFSKSLDEQNGSIIFMLFAGGFAALFVFLGLGHLWGQRINPNKGYAGPTKPLAQPREAA